jgi:hypothetical protein
MALARKNLKIVDTAGNIVNGASVEVRNEDTGLLPQLYSNRAGTVAIGNPFTASDGANAGFHVVGGSYRITATLGAFENIDTYVGIGTAQELDAEVLSAFSISPVAASANVGSISSLILADASAGNIDMTLPVPGGGNEGEEHVLKKTDQTGNRVGFIVASGGTIDSITRKYVTVYGDSIRVKSTGSAWIEI